MPETKPERGKLHLRAGSRLMSCDLEHIDVTWDNEDVMIVACVFEDCTPPPFNVVAEMP